ncbi:MAG: hypothetical protein J1F07_02065 [Muribaculaceae bacterium]|nr:hypothetical protein [Muribaculaceae bacterium]
MFKKKNRDAEHGAQDAAANATRIGSALEPALRETPLLEPESEQEGKAEKAGKDEKEGKEKLSESLSELSEIPAEDKAVAPAEDKAEARAEDKAEASAEEQAEDQAEDQAEALLQAYCLGAGINEETAGRVRQLLGTVADDITAGRFNPDAIRMALRYLSYESDIEAARLAGLAEGRAERLADAFARKRAKALEADAIPNLGGIPGGVGAHGSIFDIARGTAR